MNEHMRQQQAEAQLEQLLDTFSAEAVLAALQTVCYGKAEHLRSVWQDDGRADDWQTLARKLGPAVRSALYNNM